MRPVVVPLKSSEDTRKSYAPTPCQKFARWRTTLQKRRSLARLRLGNRIEPWGTITKHRTIVTGLLPFPAHSYAPCAPTVGALISEGLVASVQPDRPGRSYIHWLHVHGRSLYYGFNNPEAVAVCLVAVASMDDGDALKSLVCPATFHPLVFSSDLSVRGACVCTRARCSRPLHVRYRQLIARVF